MKILDKVDLVQTILIGQFPQLHMEARLDGENIVCSLNLGSKIYLGPGDSVLLITDRILEMLKDLKRVVEVDIERLER